jgi:hypothetical protein
MTNMDDREKAFESKYAYDREVMFKIEARACKLFGLWIASELGLGEEEAKSFAADVVGANLDEPGFDDVMRMVRGFLDSKGATLSDDQLETKLGECMEEARGQITGEQ